MHLRHSTGGPFIAGQSGPADKEKLKLQYEEASRTKSLYDVADSDAQRCDVEDSEVVMTRDPLVPINRKNSLSKLIRKMNVKKRKNKRRNSDVRGVSLETLKSSTSIQKSLLDKIKISHFSHEFVVLSNKRFCQFTMNHAT